MKTLFLAAMFLVAMAVAAPNGNRKRSAPQIPRLPGCTLYEIGVCRAACEDGESEYAEDGMCDGGQVCCEDDGDVIGDPHIYSLDGRRFTNQGKCSYTLMQDCVHQEHPRWSVTIKNVEGTYKGHPVTRVGSVTVRVGSHSVTLGPNALVKVNGKAVKRPLTKVDLGRDDLSLTEEDGMMEFHYEKHFTVAFDGVHHASLKVTPALESKVCGLLGNNDGDPDNDLEMPNGEQAKNTDEFAASWMVADSCQD